MRSPPEMRALPILLVLVAACTTTEAPPPPAEAPTGPRFALEYDTPTAAAGRPSVAKVRIEPRGEFHMNVDYPASLAVDAPADVDVVTGNQRSTDAKRFDGDALEFAVPFTAHSRGPKHFEGTVEFAVCGAQACAPEKVPVDFTVDVGCDTDALC